MDLNDDFDRNETTEEQPAYTSRTQKYHSQKNGRKKEKKKSNKNSRYGYQDNDISQDGLDEHPGDVAAEETAASEIPELSEAVLKANEEARDRNPLIHSDKYRDTMDTTPNPLIMKEEKADTEPTAMSRLERIRMSGDEVHSELEKKKMSKTVKAWLIALVCVIAAICLLLIFVFEIVSIEGQSMDPTLKGGEKIIAEKVSRYFNFPSKGQVVVTTYDGYDGYYVKRIIALPGEWVEIYDSTVYVNGEALEEPYVKEGSAYDDMELTQVPEGCVFLLGDNREMSLDSRVPAIGSVNAENLVGNAWCVILPFDSVRMIY